jgi:hypothetical protein
MIAISRGMTEIAKELIPKVNLDVVSTEDLLHRHALLYACYHDNEDVALMIIDIKSEDTNYLNKRDADGYSALFWAANNGNKNICKRLLEIGAKRQFFHVKAKSNDFSFINAEYLAADSMDLETFKLFIDYDMISTYMPQNNKDLNISKEDDDFAKLLMASILIEPFMVQDLNRANTDRRYRDEEYYSCIEIAHVGYDRLFGDESAEPSVEEGQRVLSASMCHELLDLCEKFFPEDMAKQLYLWEYAFGCHPKLVHAIYLGDLAMLKYLVEINQGQTELFKPSDLENHLDFYQAVIDMTCEHNDLELLKYVCEDMKVLQKLAVFEGDGNR